MIYYHNKTINLKKPQILERERKRMFKVRALPSHSPPWGESVGWVFLNAFWKKTHTFVFVDTAICFGLHWYIFHLNLSYRSYLATSFSTEWFTVEISAHHCLCSYILLFHDCIMFPGGVSMRYLPVFSLRDITSFPDCCHRAQCYCNSCMWPAALLNSRLVVLWVKDLAPRR